MTYQFTLFGGRCFFFSTNDVGGTTNDVDVGLDASFENANDELFIASADGDLLVVDLHICCGKGVDLILCHDEAAVYADEIVPG